MKNGTEQKPLFFKSAADYRAWLEKNHERAKELWIGYWKKSTGKPSLTWQECVDESLCFGWIDGVRKSIDADSFKQRLSPRRPTSIWSQINIRRVEELIAEGRMHPSGLAAFERRDRKKAHLVEQGRRAGLAPTEEARLRKNRKAWEFFQAQPPYYRRMMGWWIMSGKKEETRQRRLAILIRDSAAGRRIPLTTPKK